jgi:pantoate--beta-alanine ligase
VRALEAAEAAVALGERDPAALVEVVTKEIARAPHADLDYAELRDARTLEPIEALDRPAVLALAVRFPAPRAASGSVRLIDNRVLRPTDEDPR